VLLIVAIVLLIFLSSPWSWIAFAACMVGFVGELAFWRRRTGKIGVSVGAETLIGKTGRVVEPCRPDGYVDVEGTRWQATCPEGADPGQTVRVVSRTELVLTVRPEPAPG